jgi:hypothetical protein
VFYSFSVSAVAQAFAKTVPEALGLSESLDFLEALETIKAEPQT